MEIISPHFFLFTLVVVFVYSRLTPRAQNVWLLIASYGFYLTWGLHYTLVLVVMTAANYWIGIRLGKELSHKVAWLRFGVLFNVTLLVVLKLLSSAYGLLFFEIIHWKLWNSGLTGVLLPIGFSFYTLQAISYLVDVSRGQTSPVSDPINFALYLAYFSKILSGPLERAANFIPQLERERKVDNRQAGRGFGLILVGLLRKMIVADGLSAIRPSDIFTQPAGYSVLEHTVWLIVFAFILYNDFAGYTSIVRGVSVLLGIELSANFSQPFFARSFGDFWSRWHISLSSWLRDYVFFPLRRLAMKRRLPGWITLTIPPMVTMLASGYWHGASFAMLAWGGLHGLYQMMEQKSRKADLSESLLHRIFSVSVIFVFVTFAWILFAAPKFFDALTYIHVFLPPYGFDFPTPVWVNLIVAILISLGLDWQEYKTTSDSYFLDWSATAQSAAVFVVLLAIALFAGGGPDISNFIYQGF